MLIDTHAHLGDESFLGDIGTILKRAKQAKVSKIISIGTSIEESKRSIDLASKHKEIHATVGLYPKDPVKEHGIPLHKRIEMINILAKHPRVVAIGECGLDFTNPPPWEVFRSSTNQENLFRRQIQIARSLNLPIVIHSRHAVAETLRILESEHKKTSFKAVWHCFVEDWEVAKKLLDMNLIISLTGIITYPSGRKTRETVKRIPLSNIMVETDSPYLTPEPLRSQNVKINEPAYVKIIAEKIAEVKRISVDEVVKVTTQNAVALFKI